MAVGRFYIDFGIRTHLPGIGLFDQEVYLYKRYWPTFLKLLVSSVLIFLLFDQKEISLQTIIFEFKQAQIFWISAGILIFCNSTILGAIQWRMLLAAHQIQIPLNHAISYYFVGLFFNNFLPGYVAGDAFRIYDVTRASGNNTEALSTVIIDRLIGFLVLAAFAVLASLFWIQKSQLLDSWFLTVSLAFSGMLIAIFILFQDRIGRRIHSVLKHFVPARLMQKIKAVYWSMNSYKNQPWLLIKILFISILIQSARILTHYAAARAIGISQIHLSYFFIFIPIVALVITLPISIGGFGIREQTAVYLFGLPGIGGIPGQITSMGFLAYLVGIVCSLPGGLIFIMRKKQRSLQVKPKAFSVFPKVDH